MHVRTLLRAVTVPVSLVLVAATVLPAQAAEMRLTDRDDPVIHADILRARVVHGTRNVKVRVRFDDIHRSDPRFAQGLTLFIDTDRKNRGPEYAFTTGLNEGTDYALAKVDTWTDEGRRLHSCVMSVKLDWRKDLAVLRFARSCVKSPRSIRVSLQAVEHVNGATRSDWAPKYRTFTAPLVRG